MLTTIGIIGFGFVGKAVSTVRLEAEVIVYDKYLSPYQNNALDVIEQDIVFVCVPTSLTEDKKLDLSSVRESVHLWTQRKNRDSILVLKSTLPVGTTEALINEFQTDRIVFNPEFLTERTANTDFLHADEVILGTRSRDISEPVAQLYRSLLGPGATIKVTSPTIAELIKVARNSLYAVKIEYMNELFDLCHKLNINYADFRKDFVWEGNNAWVSDQHTYVPGPDGQLGYGGKCLPKDIQDLLTLCNESNISAPVLNGAIVGNTQRRK